ncbi:MAG TPA: N-acetyltransferase, partial [Candidatus Coatesbacteria bacterium]|nr:N-acetyltransferase [Candidatus Coatesbacteria bacterium]
MMSEREELVVRYGLRENERPEAARIFLEAFGGKMGPVLGSAGTALLLLE